METVFLEARSKVKVKLPKALLDKLPESIMLFTTTQYLDSLSAVKAQLEKAGKKVLLKQLAKCKYKGQVLGCNIEEFKQKFDAFLYVGDGLFHPKTLMLKNKRPVFVYNPLSKNHFELEAKEVEGMKKRLKGAKLKFLSSKNIGVLISIKPGQNKMNQALKLKQKYKSKEFYFLLTDTISFTQLENFPFIECFINTACPRISFDDAEYISKPIINIEDIE
ncbi:MAG: diphthamide synthesis protein [archaeon]